MAKYAALYDLLIASHPQTVTLTFAELDELIGGLPLSSRKPDDVTWWGNTAHPSRTQAKAWMGARYRVQAVDPGRSVTFAPAHETSSAPSLNRGPRVRRVLDGVEQLAAILIRAGYASVVEAVAEHTVFLHPATVRQAGEKALFPTVRGAPPLGRVEAGSDGRLVMVDDNTSPTDAFLWSAGLAKGPDTQFNHVWMYSGDRECYTALWNICATPAFLAKTTGGRNHPEVVAALRYRAFELYGARPRSEPEPLCPDGYDRLGWAPHPDAVTDLEQVIRARLRAKRRSRTTNACREIGWLFSGWEPDPSV